MPIHKLGINDKDKFIVPGRTIGKIFAKANTDAKEIILTAVSLVLAKHIVNIKSVTPIKLSDSDKNKTLKKLSLDKFKINKIAKI